MSTTDPSTPQQAAVIPVRQHGEALEVCLITKKGTQNWGVPKGMIDPGDTPEETALIEAWEEAGLKGRLLGDAVGSYEYGKWKTTFVVVVYVMEVLEEHAEWQESGIRERGWASFDVAASLLKEHPVRSLLDRAKRVATNQAS